MRIHVLAGCRDLLRPEILAPEVVAGLIGPSVRVAQARWLGPNCGDGYHDFLQEHPNDRRTAVMAESLKDEFGARFEPLLVLADLLDDEKPDDEFVSSDAPSVRRSQRDVLFEMLDSGHVRCLQLHGLSLNSDSDPDGAWAIPDDIVTRSVHERIERLRVALVGRMDSIDISTRVLEISGKLSIFDELLNNALSNHFARRLAPRLLISGLTPSFEILAGAIATILSDWNGKGVCVGPVVGQDHLEKIADLLFKRLLQS